jgi:broad specificity phosphatase PhoE
MPRRTFHTQTPLEALLVEQALLLARQLQKTADDAADGQVLAAVEATAVPAARELARKAVQATLQQQAHEAEKKGGPTAPVNTATDLPATRDTPHDPS